VFREREAASVLAPLLAPFPFNGATIIWVVCIGAIPMGSRCLLGLFEIPSSNNVILNFLKGATDIFLLFVCYAFIEFLFALDFICKNISCLLAMCWPCVTAHQQDTKTDEKYIFEPIAETPSWVLWPLRR
jgi:hypothetical protein